MEEIRAVNRTAVNRGGLRGEGVGNVTTIYAGAYREGQNDGLERAAVHLQRKADKMRNGANATADFMARIYEAEAAEILAMKSER